MPKYKRTKKKTVNFIVFNYLNALIVSIADHDLLLCTSLYFFQKEILICNCTNLSFFELMGNLLSFSKCITHVWMLFMFSFNFNCKGKFTCKICVCVIDWLIELGFMVLSHTFMAISGQDRNPGLIHNSLLCFCWLS